jgi:hypothetical protein
MKQIAGPLFQFSLGEKYPVQHGLKKVRTFEEHALRLSTGKFTQIKPWEATVLREMADTPVFYELVDHLRGLYD